MNLVKRAYKDVQGYEQHCFCVLHAGRGKEKSLSAESVFQGIAFHLSKSGIFEGLIPCL